MEWHSKLKKKLHSTASRLTSGLGKLYKQKPDERFLSELERRLLRSDMGVSASNAIIAHIKARSERDGIQTMPQLLAAVEEQITALLKPCEQPLVIPQQDRPYVILMVGVNGGGKTTTTAKLAHHYKQQGQSVLLAAADTFRAAAIEQLTRWAKRCEVPCVAQAPGADSAAVVYDAMAAAAARGSDIVIADTAGRLHTDKNLLEELKKIKRVAAKQNANAPDEIILVIDGTSGQNAKKQVAEFNRSLGIDSLIVSKLDGSAKGGIVVAIARETPLPIRFIGVGEALDDLHSFSARDYAAAMMQT